MQVMFVQDSFMALSATAPFVVRTVCDAWRPLPFRARTFQSPGGSRARKVCAPGAEKRAVFWDFGQAADESES